MSRRLPPERGPNALSRLLAAKRAAGRAVLDLTVTNPPEVGLVALDEIARAALSEPGAARYEPDPRGALRAREAVAAAYAEAGDRVDPDRVFLAASTSEAYAHLIRLLCDPGDEILVPRPSYPLLEPIARLEGVAAIPYRLTYDQRWSLDPDSLEGAAGERTKAIVVVEPNNPTGSALTAGEREAVAALAARRGMAIVADEVFREFPRPPAARPLPTWLGHGEVPTFVLGGVSKSCGLPQLKAAWIAIDGPAAAVRHAAEGLEWILDLFLSVGAPVQAALPFLLSRRGAFQAAVRARTAHALETWRAWADGGTHGPDRAPVEILAADGGWSVMLRLASWIDPDHDPAARLLEAHDVLLHPAHYYDGDDDRCLVASLLTEPARLSEALARWNPGTFGLRSG